MKKLILLALFIVGCGESEVKKLSGKWETDGMTLLLNENMNYIMVGESTY